MAVDTQGNLWVASEYALRKFAPGNNTTFTQYDTSNTPLPSDGMLDVLADPSGGIWLGTYAGPSAVSTGQPGPPTTRRTLVCPARSSMT